MPGVYITCDSVSWPLAIYKGFGLDVMVGYVEADLASSLGEANLQLLFVLTAAWQTKRHVLYKLTPVLLASWPMFRLPSRSFATLASVSMRASSGSTCRC